jgi:hypothetical protein
VSILLDTLINLYVYFFGQSYPHTIVDKLWIKCGYYVVTCTCAIEIEVAGLG